MDVNGMTTEKRTSLMKKGACFICEEPGHMARQHEEYEKEKKKKGKGSYRKLTFTPPPKKKTIQEIHALLEALLPDETKQLMALAHPEPAQEEEKEQEEEEDF